MNRNQNNQFIFDIINDASQCDISTFTDFITDLCHEDYFDNVLSLEILNNLKKLKDYREYFKNRDHPSIAQILCDIGVIVMKTSLPQLALPFLMEQLRIEKSFLGSAHPDLASVLHNIGQIYQRHNKLEDAKNYFTEALSLLNNNGRKGRVYASIIFHLGLVNYRQSFYREAMEYFDLAIVEHRAAYGDSHLCVGEIRMKVAKSQLEIGKLQEAMDNFLEAVSILRIVFGNDHTKVAECLYGIALVYEARSEFEEALDVLRQAFSSNENSDDDDDEDDDDTFSLIILHRIGLIYQSIEDTEKAKKVFQNLKTIIQSKNCL